MHLDPTFSMFSDSLLEHVLAAYRAELEKHNDRSAASYQESHSALESLLSAPLLAELASFETSCQECAKCAMEFACKRGLYVAFEQFFVPETSESPFYDFVEAEILLHPAYQQARTACNRTFSALNAQLGTAGDAHASTHLLAIQAAWDHRIHGVLRHAFYFGYRYAVSIIRELNPLDTPQTFIDKIFLTEHELGFPYNIWCQ